SISVTELRSHSKELIQRWRNSKSRRSGDKGDTLISAQEMSGGGMTQHSISQESVLPTIRMEGLLGQIGSDRYSFPKHSQNGHLSAEEVRSDRIVGNTDKNHAI